MCDIPLDLQRRFEQRWAARLWIRRKVCDACQSACATVETEAGFFLCEKCEEVVVVAFQEFELPSASPLDNSSAPTLWKSRH
jgi:hypothetical protein